MVLRYIRYVGIYCDKRDILDMSVMFNWLVGNFRRTLLNNHLKFYKKIGRGKHDFILFNERFQLQK